MDFIEWTEEALAGAEPLDAVWLSQAIVKCEGHTPYSCEALPNGHCLVSDPGMETRLVLSDQSRTAMLRHLEEHYMEGMDPDSFFGYAWAERRDQEKFGA